jgi:hypothetical protein
MDDPIGGFEEVAAGFVADPMVVRGTGFGSSPGLRYGTRIFALLSHGELVLKLPRARVSELVESGSGSRFDPGHGRLMKEWVAIPIREWQDWKKLADEALEFVRSTELR